MLVNPSSSFAVNKTGSSNGSSNAPPNPGMCLNSPTGSCGSVRLRRREHRSKEIDISKRQNRHSGDISNWSPRILSPRLFKDVSDRRQSGDWSYVSFPSSSPGTPKVFQREFIPPDVEEEQGPTSLLESKVIASILQNEGNTSSRSATGSPHRYLDRRSATQLVQTPPPPRCRSAMETLDRKLTTGSVGVRRKLLGSTRIEEEGLVDLHPLRHDSPILGSTTTPNYRPVPSSKNTVSKVKRRSQSSHYQRHENTHRFSEVIDTRSIQSDSNPDERKKCSSSTGGGLGRRSATQMELSRRKKKSDCHSETENHHYHRSRKQQKENQDFLRWKSQEHVDQLFSNEVYDDYDEEFHGERRAEGGDHRDILFEKPDFREEEEEEEDHEEALDKEEDDEEDPFKTTLKKGLLWQQKDKIFSRWKERFFILTKDYLQCFKKETNSRLSEMGGFIFKLKLSEVELVELVDKKGYLTVCLSLPKDGKVLLRKNEGIRDWFSLLKNCVNDCRSRSCMKSTEEFWSKKNFQDSPNSSPSNFDRWLLARQRIGQQYNYVVSGAVPASEDFMSLPVVSSPIDAEYYHRKSRQLKDITSPLTHHRTPSKTRRSTSRNNHLNYADLGGGGGGTPCDSPRDNQRKSLFVSDNNFDSGNDSMNTNTSTGRSTTDIQRVNKRETGGTGADSSNNKSNYRRSQFISPAQSTRV
ncbi:uncharacterized protein [Lepeophtheirus salmonis]|uniref:uncharacterized protein isoform X2 n=1 Tax=Lepeophtheirus salmonis TaxID=72036 RepID=UPI001AE19CFE|nr:uncharacterized protein LOC121130089 isoform X2 [Lepeophtheirus salmonis]